MVLSGEGVTGRPRKVGRGGPSGGVRDFGRTEAPRFGTGSSHVVVEGVWSVAVSPWR